MATTYRRRLSPQRRNKAGQATIASGNGISPRREPTALACVAKGIKNSTEFENLMAAVIHDALDNRISERMLSAVAGAGRNMLRSQEMRLKYGGKVIDAKARVVSYV